ncbi:MAG TPA: AsmA-like C-terminal region-containing protein [Bacteroidales bacterium]|nr:AsmA-like C-terminal region-containing protein [Bacteroidales bacterium]
MKKFIKIFFISLLSLVGVLIIAVSIVIWIVFTPARITPIVRKQAAKYITCKSEIGSVELTFFSTFPNFGLKIRNFALINPVNGSMSDTLVSVNELVGVVDAKAYWKKKDIILIGLEMNGGSVNVYSDSLGHTNYNITPVDTTPAPAVASKTELPFIDIRNIEVKNVSLHYNDLSLKLNTVIRNLSAKINGTISHDSISGNVTVNTSMLSVEYTKEKLNTEIRDLSAKINGTVIGDNISGNVKASSSMISLEYGGEKYMQQASVHFDLPIDVITSREFIRFKNATASINDLELLLNGTIENDTVSKNITTDLTYKLASWPVKNILALVPASYKSYFNGIEVDGLLSSDGSIKGIYNGSHMPLMDMHLLFEKGTLKYSAFSLPLHDVNGDLSIQTDLTSDPLSFVRINRFTAKTPQSTISTEGMVTHLFKDISCNLTSTAGLTLDEFNSMIPASMKTTIRGKASGQVKSSFTMSQVEKMQFEKMKLSGSVTLSDFDVKYDSISLKADKSKIDFALPNNNPLSKNTGFVFASIISDNVVAGKLASYNASLTKSSLILETSDVRDSTRIPDLICSFSMDAMTAGMNDMSIAIAAPHGKVAVSPRPGNPLQPHIILSYKSGELKTAMGKNFATVNKISTDLDISNDNTQKDIFLQWLVKGYIDMNQGLITMSELTNTIEIPSVKMDFDPETFNIKESSMKIGRSDFQLTGNLNNVLSYFRGDSILRGKFNFVSNKTDVAQLMALTSGIGTYDSASVNKQENTSVDTISTGPYMVPKKIDVTLNASIKLATIGVDTATNITGAVQVHDGILLLDGLKFTTPAARMQLTAMYRTPRKNHLYLGIDYQMMDVEISELLTMIPDIDSMMPMLRSFGGKGEFHIAAETYLDSLYNVKKSTVRGAASIKGNNLILMDGQTFSEIAKKLRFNKKTQNKVDSLAAEFTIFRNEIDIYPFLIVMDKYKAVVAGRHNLDMTFDYHVSVVDCPLPIKLGVDIKGNVDNLSYKLVKCRYAEYFRPTSRHEVETKQLELRKMIRQALAEKVKE